MRAERERIARDLRARGAEAAERIRADADRQQTEIVAEAYREAEQIRGEGDAKSAEIYASAFQSNAGVLLLLAQPRRLSAGVRAGWRHDGAQA